MTGNILRLYKRPILSLLILCFSSGVVFAQKTLSGDLNQPAAHVISIPAGDRVIVDDVTGFSAIGPDTVLVIQMQGVGINVPTTGYGFIQSIYGQPGLHEFMIIQSVNSGTHEIVFRNNLINAYDPKGNIQIVRVPYYNNASVTGKLFCKPWNSATKKGGVLALVMGRTLKLDADIDVSNSGFTGGKDSIGDGRCAFEAPTTLLDYYARNFTNAGFKGEGLAIHDDFGTLLAPLHSKGQGPNFTGGGGGNGRFSGGGGGSNRGTGGFGGTEDNSLVTGCPLPQPGGKGGFASEQPTQPAFINRVFLGGGGGASTSPAGNSPPAGNGGGIVIIVSDSIIGNGGKIIADGGNGGSGVATGGSGGGGGGGSIALSLNSYGSSPLTFSVSGGKGGDNLSSSGVGGGGGGGFIYVSTNTTGNVVNKIDGGLAGNYLAPSTSDGSTGEKRVGFKVVLNGFLFNSIRSSITGNQIDSICSDVVPFKITGTIPVGGTGPYTYLWERSYDQVSWAPLVNDSPDPTNYTPTAPEPSTVWFRRTITDASATPLVDVSKSVKIIVQPSITGNIIGKDTVICSGQNPLPLIPLNSGPANGNGISYNYKWLKNSIDANWDSTKHATGAVYTNPSYDPPSLTQPTYYKRFVQSGRCISYSSTVTVNVLPPIVGNSTIRSDSVICEGSLFPLLSATAPGGGDLSYTFQWQDSVSTWNPASGINPNTFNTYAVDTSKFPLANNEKRFFRRLVFSGPLNTCQAKSAPILLTRYHKIKNNLVQSDQIICSGDVPQGLTGVTASPSGGTGAYSYLWEQSTNGTTSWDNADNTNNSINYSPHSLNAPAWYRRTVYSGLFNSLPVCSSTSPFVAISVQPSIANNSISILGSGPDTTICSGQRPNQLRKIGPALSGGNNIYSVQWVASSTATGSYTNITGATGLTFSEAALPSSKFYKLKVSSGKCLSESNIASVNVLPKLAGFNIESDQSICKNLPLAAISSIVPGPSGGDGNYRYKWLQNIANAGWTNIPSNSTSAGYSKSSISEPTEYKRYIYSGPGDCCQDTSNIVSISILPLPALPNPGPDTTIYSLGKVYQMKATAPPAGETGAWTIISGEGKTDDNSYNTFARELNGSTTFLWTVTKGTCTLDSTVVITLSSDDKAIPQGFSPNYDSKNDVFKIEGLYKKDETVQLNIVNGAGTEVFSTYVRNGDTSTWKDWDGKNSAGIDLPEGTYYYILKVTTSKGYVSRKSGFIILKRY
jgi:gliding motility-associated-like protein